MYTKNERQMMARVKLSEFRAKSLLIDDYDGVTIRKDSAVDDVANLSDNQKYVVKVDQGVKKRGKQGLLHVNLAKDDIPGKVESLAERGFERFIAEPMVSHDEADERYVSFERTRSGINILYSEQGGVAVEDDPDSVTSYSQESVPLPADFVKKIISVMNKEHFSFLEINPLLVDGENCTLLDAAVLADSAGAFQASWSEDDIVEARTLTESEAAVASLDDNSPAAFSFRVLNPDGAIWLLLSGGGASITIADEAMNQNRADAIGNYGEYSGGPSAEETYLYTGHVMSQVLRSTAKKKAIIIAGGVANFTDVRKTFTGVIKAFEENKAELQKADAHVFVRRGGPNEEEGLKLMETFLKNSNLYGSVHGSDVVLTDVINEALEYIDA